MFIAMTCYNYSKIESVTIIVILPGEYSVNRFTSPNLHLKSLIHMTVSSVDVDMYKYGLKGAFMSVGVWGNR